jgi:hypothetical protein
MYLASKLELERGSSRRKANLVFVFVKDLDLFVNACFVFLT